MYTNGSYLPPNRGGIAQTSCTFKYKLPKGFVLEEVFSNRIEVLPPAIMLVFAFPIDLKEVYSN